MRIAKYIFLFLALLGCEQARAWFNRSHDYKERRYQSKQATQRPVVYSLNCKSEDSCLDDPNCLCYCSEVCHYRRKFKSDKPVFVAEDRVEIDAETGKEYVIPKGCYCKQWDLDVYANNCKKYLGRKSMHIGRDMRRIKDGKLVN